MTRAEYLKYEARHCRMLAESISDDRTRHILLQLATEYDAEAAKDDIGVSTRGQDMNPDPAAVPPSDGAG